LGAVRRASLPSQTVSGDQADLGAASYHCSTPTRWRNSLADSRHGRRAGFQGPGRAPPGIRAQHLAGVRVQGEGRLTRNVRNPGKPEFRDRPTPATSAGPQAAGRHDALQADVHLAVDLGRVGHVLHDGEPPERVLDCLRDRLCGCGPSLPPEFLATAPAPSRLLDVPRVRLLRAASWSCLLAPAQPWRPDVGGGRPDLGRALVHGRPGVVEVRSAALSLPRTGPSGLLDLGCDVRIRGEPRRCSRPQGRHASRGQVRLRRPDVGLQRS